MSNPAERRLAATIGAHQSWANTENRPARTAPARAAADARFLMQAGGDPVRAAHLRKAYYSRLALRSAQSRRRAREARENAVSLERVADDADSELSTAGGAA